MGVGRATVCSVAGGDPLITLLEEHLVASLLKQARLEDRLTGAEAWSVDLDEGVLVVGDARFPADVLGVESRPAGAFAWAWAVEDLPAERVASAPTVRTIGAQRGVPELVTPAVPLEAMDAQLAGIAAAGLANADAFWIGDHDDGSVLFLVRDEHLRARPWPLAALPTIVAGVVESGLPVDHRRTIDAFAARPPHGLLAERQGARATFSGVDGEVTVELGEDGRIAGVRAELAGGD